MKINTKWTNTKVFSSKIPLPFQPFKLSNQNGTPIFFQPTSPRNNKPDSSWPKVSHDEDPKYPRVSSESSRIRETKQIETKKIEQKRRRLSKASEKIGDRLHDI